MNSTVKQQSTITHLKYSIRKVAMFGTKPQIKRMVVNSITIGKDVIPVKQLVRNLGAHFDTELKIGAHGNKIKITKADYFYLRQYIFVAIVSCE